MGTRLGDFEVQAPLSTGGMGVVYRGVQPAIGKAVAIKVIRSELLGSPEVARMLDEARAVNAIGHPGIVDIFTIGNTPDGRPFLVMELVDGQSLAEVLAQRGALPPAEVVSVLKGVLAPLEAAHRAGVIHRDLKPENIMVSYRHQQLAVKLLDFGLAKRTTPREGAPQTKVGSFVGSPAYVSPEQARAQALTPASDLYSVGCVAYQLLTGQLPYPCESPWEMVIRHSTEPTPSARTLAPQVPEALAALVARLMSKLSADRPQSAREVIELLETSLGSSATDGVPPLRPPSLTRISAHALLASPMTTELELPRAAKPAQAQPTEPTVPRASAPPLASQTTEPHAPRESAPSAGLQTTEPHPARASAPSGAPLAAEPHQTRASAPPPGHRTADTHPPHASAPPGPRRTAPPVTRGDASSLSKLGPVPQPALATPPTTEVDSRPPVTSPGAARTTGTAWLLVAVFLAAGLAVFIVLDRRDTKFEPQLTAPPPAAPPALAPAPQATEQKSRPPVRSKATQAWLDDREVVLKQLDAQEARNVDVRVLRGELQSIERAREQGQVDLAGERLRALRQRLQH